MFAKYILPLLLLAAGPRVSHSQFERTAAIDVDDPYHGTGVSPHRTLDYHYRLTASYCANAGLITDAPLGYSLFGGFQYQHRYLSAGFLTSSSTGFGQPRRSWLEVATLYGYAMSGNDIGIWGKRADRIFLGTSVGLSYVQYATRYRLGRRGQPVDSVLANQPNTLVRGVGLPVQVQASYALSRFAGIGAMIFADLNTVRFSYGGGLSIQLGYF